MMRMWKVETIGNGWVAVHLRQEGVPMTTLFVSSIEAGNQLGRIWVESDPNELTD
jgi:hypothetical protein